MIWSGGTVRGCEAPLQPQADAGGRIRPQVFKAGRNDRTQGKLVGVKP